MAEEDQELGDRDEELLRAAKAAPEGDMRAFERLVEQYQRRILADCRYMTRDANNAEDLAQEVFVKAFFGLRTFEGRSSFRHWLQRIKVNHCLNHIKKQDGKTGVSIEEDGMEAEKQMQVPPLVEREIEAIGDQRRIGGILDAMPAVLRLPLIMRDMDELSYEEVAKGLGIGLSAAKMRIRRARDEFRRRYEREAT